MPYIAPAIPDFKAQFVRDFPYAVPLSAKGGGSGAVVTATTNGANQSVDSLTIVNGGTGYPTTANLEILIYGLGFGAVAKGTVVGGALTAVTIVNGGYGYALPPTVYVAPGSADDTNEDKVTDRDIINAFNATQNFNFSQTLFGSQAAYTFAFNLLAAHYLCETLQNAMAGISGKAEWITQAKTVGNVTESYNIPDRIMRSPYLSKLSKTTYGAQFLELVSPQLIGNMVAMHRPSLP